MSSEEYDDLDELLDGDQFGYPVTPAEATGGTNDSKNSVKKLDEGAGTTINDDSKQGENDKVHGGPAVLSSLDDSDLKEVVQDLQEEFSNLMKDTSNEDAPDLEKLWQMVQEKTKNAEAHESDSNLEKKEYRHIMSETLDRLRDNGAKVDSKISEEQQHGKIAGTGDDVLSQLLDKFMESNDGNPPDEGSMDDAILQILNQMSSKEILYTPIKEMHEEFRLWMNNSENLSDPKITTYRKQFELIEEIVFCYEEPDYTNEKYNEKITQLLDELQELGDTPVGKATSDSIVNKVSNSADGMDDGLEFDEKELEKQLNDTCKQQ